MRSAFGFIALAALAAPSALGAHLPRAIADLDPKILSAMQSQAPYSLAASTIQKAVMKAGSEGSGFSGVEIAPTGDSVNLFWKNGGPIPALVAEAIEAAKDIKINIQSSPFSREDLTLAAESLKSVLQNASNPFHSVSVSHIGKGLEIAGEVNIRDTFGRVADPESTLQQAAESTNIGGILKDVPFTLKSANRPYQTARYNDNAPWEGGIAICSDTGIRCTAGFAVADENTGQKYLLTAAHCNEQRWGACVGNKDTASYTPSRYIGVVTRKQVDRDVMLIATENVKSQVWDGALGNDFVKNVLWWENVVQGESLCFSGSTTGIKCGLTVYETWLFLCFSDTDCEWLAHSRTSDNTTPLLGDSGGPVFRVLPNNNWNTVAMKGVVSGGGGDAVYIGLFSEAYRLWKVSEL
ncbi:hypothetical protein BJ742DRAFT_803461 [Cladochytrium replicatum]|nr:hypothetical protein BJ742DRAFT_803461 [Cladochytrium replicatum]